MYPFRNHFHPTFLSASSGPIMALYDQTVPVLEQLR